MTKSLLGKNAVVTGGSRGMRWFLAPVSTRLTYTGIGAAIAIELARRGASVLITYVSSAKAADVVTKEIENQGSGVKGYAVQADCAHATESVSKIVSEAEHHLSGIDIIVNNAADGSDVSLADLTLENFDHAFHTNVLFPMLLVQQCRPHLRRKARIVNISSTSARKGKRKV